jgi:hypothetical protein
MVFMFVMLTFPAVGSSSLAIATTMEISSGIIASSLATLRPLLSSFLPPGTIDEIPSPGRPGKSTFSFNRPWRGRLWRSRPVDCISEADTNVDSGSVHDSGSSRTRHGDDKVEEIIMKDLEKGFGGLDLSVENHFGIGGRGSDGAATGTVDQSTSRTGDNESTTIGLGSGNHTIESNRKSWRQSLKHSLRSSWNPIHGTWFDFRSSEYAGSEAGDETFPTSISQQRRQEVRQQDEHTFMFHPVDLGFDDRPSNAPLATHILPPLAAQQPRRVDSKARLGSPKKVSVEKSMISSPKPAFISIKPPAVPPKQTLVPISTPWVPRTTAPFGSPALSSHPIRNEYHDVNSTPASRSGYGRGSTTTWRADGGNSISPPYNATGPISQKPKKLKVRDIANVI